MAKRMIIQILLAGTDTGVADISAERLDELSLSYRQSIKTIQYSQHYKTITHNINTTVAKQVKWYSTSVQKQIQ